MKPISILLKSFLILLWISGTVMAQSIYTPSDVNHQNREWFQSSRFGLFIHWGVYSVLGDGEWVMNQQQISIRDYEKLPAFFNPTAFDAKRWVQLAKNAGMKYIVITSKHHDGFAMWDSRVSDYTIVKRSPYGKDVLKMLADECHREGIKLFFYHSQLDWHHPDYFPRGGTGGSWTGRPEQGNWNAYLDYMDAQLTELLTGYGELGGIWFDGMWDKKDADWRLARTYSLIHKLQPGALVGSNHHVAPFAGEDFQMFEKDLPGHNTTGFAPEQKIGDLPKEICETINRSWGFDLKDNHHKSAQELVQYLVKAAGYDANFLLNIGPMPNGQIQPEHVERLLQVGNWLTKNGDTIYGTRGGPLTARDWGVTTQKGDRVFVHILRWSDNVLTIPSWGKKIKAAKVYGTTTSVRFAENEYGITLQIPPGGRQEFDTIIELQLK